MADIQVTRMQRLHMMLEAQPDDSFLLFALAKELDVSGEDVEAIATYERLLVNDPDYLGAYYHLAEILDRIEQTDRAINIADQGITLAKKQNNEKDLAELVQLRASF